ncbi:PrsW family intramembrane metalloprotease [Corynebacterium uropygiale]|uniref:PrsW family intramembrane metalloprotease n=1 Tax=Corynebacterium uropygiale TaxID=1775911 RepID=A0A9X1QQB9_9CORY|nr:PrsW family intramembrane metalloprotease [Corynebacterium uropygiale]MCF4005624.1 PrsW family intramembrane metalloprotease [Corynebacterium uropygiale]
MIVQTLKNSVARRDAAPWVLGVCLLIGAVGLLLHLGVAARVSWQGVLFGLPLAILQAAVLVGLLRLSPLWRGVRPAHPSRLGWPTVAAALLWGGGVAVVAAPLLANPMKDLVSALGWVPLEASLAGAWPEEFLKGLGVVLILLSVSHLCRPWQGLLMGALIGLGFEVQENLMYGYVEGLAHPDSDAVGMAATWLMRVLGGPFLHACWTALIGWGVGLALYGLRKDARRRAVQSAAWMCAGLALHLCWNLAISNEAFAVVWMVLIAVLSYGAVLTVGWRQTRWLRAHRESIPQPVG